MLSDGLMPSVPLVVLSQRVWDLCFKDTWQVSEFHKPAGPWCWLSWELMEGSESTTELCFLSSWENTYWGFTSEKTRPFQLKHTPSHPSDSKPGFSELQRDLDWNRQSGARDGWRNMESGHWKVRAEPLAVLSCWFSTITPCLWGEHWARFLPEGQGQSMKEIIQKAAQSVEITVMEAGFLWVCAHVCVNECVKGKALECIIQRWSELGFPCSRAWREEAL